MDEPKFLVAIDLFCGVGGMTHGFVKEGVKVVAGVDLDPSCRFAFERNNKSKFIEGDICNIPGKDLAKLYPPRSIKIMIGCAPCQTFSPHTMKIKSREKDPRWNLLYQFLRIVKESKPDIISMENVPQLAKYKIFFDFVKGLEEEQYIVNYDVIYCPRYGIPQKRSRLVLLASKKGKIELSEETNEPENYPTIKEFIGNLPKIRDGEICKTDDLHRSWNLSPINKLRIKKSKQGGSWMDWDKKLRLRCHKKKKGMSYRAVYGRMKLSEPSPTITTQFYSYGTGRFGHPTQNRAISLREGAILQTFPLDYEFVKKGEEIVFSKVGRHIGNAVPVDLGRVIAKSIKNHIQLHDKW